MSGWSGIYFRYDIEDKGIFKMNYKGLIGNQYKGFEPYHIFVRATEGVNAAIGCLTNVAHGNVNERISRTIDVDFVCRYVADSIKARIWYNDDEDVNNEAFMDKADSKNENLGINASSFFFNDCNYYGGFFVDVKGYVRERVEVDESHPNGRRNKLEIKYAFVDNTSCPQIIMTPRQYVEHFAEFFNDDCYGKEIMDEINGILTEYDEEPLGELMTRDELAEYVSIKKVKEYLHNNE